MIIIELLFSGIKSEVTLFVPVLDGGSEPGLQGFEILGLDNFGVTGLAGWGVPGLESLGVPGLAGWDVPGLKSLGVPGLAGWDVPGLEGLDIPGRVCFFVLGLDDVFLPGLVGLDNPGPIGKICLSSPADRDKCPGNRGSPDGSSSSSPLTTALL